MNKLKLINNIKEEVGLDPNTLIFDPEKAEKFIAEVNRKYPGRIAFMPVRPDWNEAKKVFGYYNPLTGLFYPTDGLKVLLNAFRALMGGKNDEKYFIILDEMNLARVEYYFSDILSLMENMWKIPKKGNSVIRGETAQIHSLERCILSKIPANELENWQEKSDKICDKDCNGCPYQLLVGIDENGKYDDAKESVKNEKWKEVEKYFPIPPRIAYPQNLVIIGTVNVDETTYSFAPKVLDRAFQLEFTDVYWEEFLKGKQIEENSPFYKFVGNLQKILKPRNMHFGYRVINEMLKYLEMADKNDDNTYDFLLKSKILPKFHGTEEQIGDVLLKLLAFCAGKDNYEIESEAQDRDKTFMATILETSGEKRNWWQLDFDYYRDKFQKYPESARKLWQMYQNMKATGYCSFF